MRIVAGLLIAGVVVCAAGATWMRTQASPLAAGIQQAAVAPAAPKQLAPKTDLKTDLKSDPKTDALADVTGAIPEPKPAASPGIPACSNPNALGIARVVEVDTTGGPGFGFEHFKQLDFLNDKEVVLTFDDGPWPVNTPAVLKALADECTTGVFFSIGKHASYHPEILRQVAAAGHTIGSHTWSHANLNKNSMTEQQGIDEIEKGLSAVRMALGTEPASFFRFPELQHSPAMVSYLGTRNIAIFSCDIDSFDFRAKNPEQIIETVMTKLNKQGKGIILLHDFQKHTGEALPALLSRLKAGGYKIVQMKSKAPAQTLGQYDEEMLRSVKVPTISTRPVASVVQTVSVMK
jgi:peptidoglycan/xylan/chitin deacetylase (PgdA/CDA1 family)